MVMQNTSNPMVSGWGVDVREEDRPGVPKETRPPEPLSNRIAIDQQVHGPLAVRDASRPVTPVYASAVPPRGLSGILRRAAYRVPDYKPRRWMMLLIADRIDVMEHAIVPVALVLGGVAAILGGAYAVKRLREA
jgi:hypothetical protein